MTLILYICRNLQIILFVYVCVLVCRCVGTCMQDRKMSCFSIYFLLVTMSNIYISQDVFRDTTECRQSQCSMFAASGSDISENIKILQDKSKIVYILKYEMCGR